MTIWPKNLFQAKKLTQKYKIDPKIYFPAKKVPSKMAHPVSQYMGVTPPPQVIIVATIQGPGFPPGMIIWGATKRQLRVLSCIIIWGRGTVDDDEESQDVDEKKTMR